MVRSERIPVTLYTSTAATQEVAESLDCSLNDETGHLGSRIAFIPPLLINFIHIFIKYNKIVKDKVSGVVQ